MLRFLLALWKSEKYSLQKSLSTSHKINFYYFKADVFLMHTRSFFSVINVIRRMVDCNTTLQWFVLHLPAFWRKRFSTVAGLVVSVVTEKPTSHQSYQSKNKKANLTWSKTYSLTRLFHSFNMCFFQGRPTMCQL